MDPHKTGKFTLADFFDGISNIMYSKWKNAKNKLNIIYFYTDQEGTKEKKCMAVKKKKYTKEQRLFLIEL